MAKKRPAQVPAKKRPAKPKPKPENPPKGAATTDRVSSLRSVGLAVISVAIGVLIGVMLAGGIRIEPSPPTPDPAPIPEPVKSFRVIFVKESGQTLSGEQTAIPGAAEIREFLDSTATQEGNTAGWREFDPDQQTSNEQATMKALWEAVKPKLLPAPCLIVEVNGHAKVLPFPANVAECMQVLKKAAGE
jgi:hypothetical protein